MEIKIDLTNCFGIGRLSETINYVGDAHTAVVYAPNGTMKTSLTKTFQRLIDKKQPADEMYANRLSSSSITIDGSSINKDNVYIFVNNDKDGASGISTFLANATLKSQYDTIFAELMNAKIALKNRVKEIAHSSDCEEEVHNAFKQLPTDTYLDCLLHIKGELDNDAPFITGLNFKFNDIFDTGEKVKTFVNENMTSLEQYFSKYQELVNSSSFFTSGVNSFGTNQATTLLKSIEDNRFFTASHKMLLRDSREITSKEDIVNVITTERERIFEDRTLKSLFDKIEKKLMANADLRGFKDVLIAYPELVAELRDYEGLRKKVLRGYMQACSDLFTNMVSLYEEKKTALRSIVEQANTQRSQWEKVIDMFNSRFFVPFTLELKNKADILLSDNVTPELTFNYHDGGDAPIVTERKELVEHLSRGEQKAFYILQNIFEIEARKSKSIETLLVFDDIADSFDYKNKYAIIEYLSDIARTSHFYLLILTHNFDFYRTIVSRFEVGSNIFFAHKQDDRSISFKQGLYKPDILKVKFINNITKKRPLIGCIPFIRNIIEYTHGTNDTNYLKLTSCLHIKADTSAIEMRDIFAIVQKTITSTSDKVIDFPDKNYLDGIYEEADSIVDDSNEIDIVNKLVLSMAIRLKAETYMLHILTEEQKSEMKQNKNQTGELVKIFKKYHYVDQENVCILVGKVLMLTSENIHLNNFMFEPLVDISILYLKELYKDCKTYLEIV